MRATPVRPSGATAGSAKRSHRRFGEAEPGQFGRTEPPWFGQAGATRDGLSRKPVWNWVSHPPPGIFEGSRNPHEEPRWAGGSACIVYKISSDSTARVCRGRTAARLLKMGRNTIARYTRRRSRYGRPSGRRPERAAESCEVLRSAVDEHAPASTPTAADSPRSNDGCRSSMRSTAMACRRPRSTTSCRLEHSDFVGSLSAIKRRCAALRRGTRRNSKAT